MVSEEEINTRYSIHSKLSYKKFMLVWSKRTNEGIETESRRSSMYCPETSSTAYRKERKFLENYKVQLMEKSICCQGEITFNVKVEEKVPCCMLRKIY